MRHGCFHCFHSSSCASLISCHLGSCNCHFCRLGSRSSRRCIRSRLCHGSCRSSGLQMLHHCAFAGSLAVSKLLSYSRICNSLFSCMQGFLTPAQGSSCLSSSRGGRGLLCSSLRCNNANCLLGQACCSCSLLSCIRSGLGLHHGCSSCLGCRCLHCSLRGCLSSSLGASLSRRLLGCNRRVGGCLSRHLCRHAVASSCNQYCRLCRSVCSCDSRSLSSQHCLSCLLVLHLQLATSLGHSHCALGAGRHSDGQRCHHAPAVRRRDHASDARVSPLCTGCMCGDTERIRKSATATGCMGST